MSGSGHSDDGSLTPSPGWVADIKQTLKLLFKQVEVTQAPLGVDPPEAIVWASPVPDTYGGQLLTNEADWFPFSLVVPSTTHTAELVNYAELSSNQALSTDVLVPLAEDNLVGDGLMQLMDDTMRQIETDLPDAEPASVAVETFATQAQGEFTPIKQVTSQRTPMHFARKAINWGVRFHGAKPLPPIVRRSLPLSSLTERQKYALLKLMAEKAQCKIHEVKLIAVYDRLFVSAYQSMRPTPDGQLWCYPKSTQLNEPPPGLKSTTMKTGLNPMAARTSGGDAEAYWLLVGQRNQQPPVPLMTMVTHQQIQALWTAKKGGAS